MYNLNSYEKHKCFSGLKTHGEKRKPTAMKRKSGTPVQGESAKKKKVPSAAAGAPEGKEMEESGAGKEFAIGAAVKVEKADDDDDDIIVIK